ncbi:MAG TPA: PH domain-containing protein [Candidatus Dojkabacteria bacterium]|nr:PH domain-containing protein [Candidatus Dojkabacteria bacterium]
MNAIPKKFLKGKRSFITKLSPEVSGNNTGSFCVFPADVHFSGQDSHESVVLIVRRHPAVFIPQYLTIIGLLLAPFLFMVTFGSDDGFSPIYKFGIWLLFLLIAFTAAIDTYLKWYYTVNIITDSRIIDVDFTNILFHRFSEAQLDKIEDVSHSPAGVLSSIFDYGDVYIQTAGSKPEFEFGGIPRPRDVQDTLLDLLEMKKKGDI